MLDAETDSCGLNEISKWSASALIEHNVSIIIKPTIRHGSNSIIIPVIMDGDIEEDYDITEAFDLFFNFSLEINTIKSLKIAPCDQTTTKPMTTVLATKANLEDPLSPIRITKRPQPTPPEGWVTIKLTAAALNYHDIFTLRGLTAYKPKYSHILGCEVAGTLEDGTPVVLYPGMGDPDFKGGETLDPKRHIFSELVDRALANYIVAPKRSAIKIPEGLDPVEASVLGIAWLTAYQILFTKSGLRAGQTMLVQSSSGVVTTALIQKGSGAEMRVWCTRPYNREASSWLRARC